MPHLAERISCRHSGLAPGYRRGRRSMGVLASRYWFKADRPWILNRDPDSVASYAFSDLQAPPELRSLRAAIERSREITELQENWDEEGSPGYSVETWRRATTYLERQVFVCWDRHGVVIPTPWITPGPDGSIDIHWQTDLYELLVNFPADPSEPAAFYGDDYGRMSIKGQFDPQSEPAGHLALVSWLTRD